MSSQLDLFAQLTPPNPAETVQTQTPALSESGIRAAITAPAKDPAEPPNAPEWVFPFDFTDARGERYIGEFTHKVPNEGTKILIARTKAGYLGGLPIESFDPDVRDFLDMLAHLSNCLTARPKWAQDLLALRENGEVIYALWQKASAHMARYFRRKGDT